MKLSALALACLVGFSFALDPRMEQGARFEAQGNYEMALGEYRAILAEQPKNADAYFAAAEVRVKMKDYSGALANYRLAYKFEPEKSAAYEGAAKVYEVLGQKAKAEAERAKDPKNNPSAAPVVEQAAAPAAEVKAESAPVAKVESEPAPVAKVEPAAKPESAPVAKPEPAPVAKAEPAPVAKAEPVPAAKFEPAPVAKTEPAPAAESAKTLPSDPFEKGKVLYAEGKYNEAAPLWREVLKKTPGHAGAYFYAGLTRFQLGEYEKAEFNLKKGLEYKEEGNDANYFLACVYQKTNKPDLEVKFLANYVKKAAPKAKYRKAAEERLAAIKAAKAEAAKAETAKVETVKQDEAKPEPAKSEVVAAVAETKAAPAVVPATAAAESTTTGSGDDVAAAPSAVPTIANANLLFSAGSYELALQMYKSLLETEQNPEERYFTMLQLGNAYRELRDFHSAVTRYREVVQQFPDSDWATEAERALEDAVWLEKHAKELPRQNR